MTTQEACHMTRCVLLSTVILLVGYNIFVGLKYGIEPTISVQVYELARMHPIIPFVMGLVVGHFLWPLCQEFIQLLRRI